MVETPLPSRPVSRPSAAWGAAAPLLALAALALGAGILHRNPLAAAFSLPLLLGPPAAWWLTRRALSRMRVERRIPEAAFEDDEIEVGFSIHNESRLAVFYPAVNDLFTPEHHEPKTLRFPFRLIGRETIDGSYTGQCNLPRGLHAIGPGEMVLADPFGWTRFRREIPISPPFKVYPRILEFGLRDRRGDAASASRIENTLFGRGESQEFFSVREYRFGDPLRRVHWPLSAHRGIPVVREFLLDSAGSLTLFFDLYRPALVGVGKGSSLEHAVKILVALANQALRRGHRIQAFACGKEALLVPAGAGRGQMSKLLDLAVQARPEGDLPLPGLIDRHRLCLKRGDCVLLPVSPYLFNDGGFLGLLAGLRRQGIQPVAILFDDATFRPLWYGQSTGEGKTAEFQSRLEALGVESFRVACGARLDQIFRRAAR